MMMRLVSLGVVLLAIASAQDDEPAPSYDDLLAQHNANLQNTRSQQFELQRMEQQQQDQRADQLRAFLMPQPQQQVQAFDTASNFAGEMGQSGESIDNPANAANGLPFVPMDQAVQQFVQHQQQILQEEQAQEIENAQIQDLEKDDPATQKSENILKPKGFGVHQAVPKLQQWLAAMDPISYSSPTFSNPVATQVFKKLSNPSLPFSERERLQRLVSSPYMFNMLGHPGFSDSQLWSGLVSGAAVPFPLRNVIMSQRTEIPFRIATTGDSMSSLDHVAMNEYSKLLENNPQIQSLGPNAPTHLARHRLFKIISHLNKQQNNLPSQISPTPHTPLSQHEFASPVRGKVSGGKNGKKNAKISEGGLEKTKKAVDGLDGVNLYD